METILELPLDTDVQEAAQKLLAAAVDAQLYYHNFGLRGGLQMHCPYCLEHKCKYKNHCIWGLTYNWKEGKIDVIRFGMTPCVMTEVDFCEFLGFNDNLLHLDVDAYEYWSDHDDVTDVERKALPHRTTQLRLIDKHLKRPC